MRGSVLIGSERRGSLVVFEAGVNVEEDVGTGDYL
jgi:hypothetical protein